MEPENLRKEGNVQNAFDEQLSKPLETIFQALCGKDNDIGESWVRPTYSHFKTSFRPDIVHCKGRSGHPSGRLCYAMGDFKTVTYRMPEGFSKLMAQMDEHGSPNGIREKDSSRKRSFFKKDEYNANVLFSLVARKYLYQASGLVVIGFSSRTT